MKRAREVFVDVGYLRYAESDLAPEEFVGLASMTTFEGRDDEAEVRSCDVLIDRRTGTAFTLTGGERPMLPGFAETLDQYRDGEL